MSGHFDDDPVVSLHAAKLDLIRLRRDLKELSAWLAPMPSLAPETIASLAAVLARLAGSAT